MEDSLRLDALVAPLRADVVSGASVVGRMAAEVVRRAAGRIPAQGPDDFRFAMGRVLTRVLDAQPAMAPLVALARDVLDALEDVDGVEAARTAATEAADHFRGGLDTRTQVVAGRASSLLPKTGRVVTVSSSSTVKAALLHEAHARQVQVVCLESRPMQEGRLLASALAKEGVDVTLAVDAAAAAMVAGADMVLLGADALGDRGVVNKVGSVSLADAAAREGVPVHVLTDETKILPPGFPQHLADDRPAEEVWKAPAGVRIWNRYFEALPLDRVTSVLTERATRSPEEIEEVRKEISIPEELRSWAAGTGGR